MYGKRMRSRRPATSHRRHSTAKRKEHIHRGVHNFTATTPLPKERSLKLRTATTVTCTASSGALNYFVVPVSSAAVLGGTPPGDLWGYFYNHYIVTGCKVTLNFGINNVNAASPIVLGTYFEPNTTTPSYSQYEYFVEAGRGTYRFVTASAAAGAHKMDATYSCRKAYSTNINDDQNDLGAPISYSLGNSTWHVPSGIDSGASIIVWVQSQDKTSTSTV